MAQATRPLVSHALHWPCSFVTGPVGMKAMLTTKLLLLLLCAGYLLKKGMLQELNDAVKAALRM